MSDKKTNETATLLPTGTDDQGHTHGLMFEQDGSVSEIVMLPPGSGGDRVHTRPREGTDFLDVEFVGDRTHTGTGHEGPPRVSSAAFQAGWDRIWGQKTVGEA